PVALPGLVTGELALQPLAQQARAAPLDRVVLQRRIGGQDAVELGEGVAGQRGLGLDAVRREVGQAVVARAVAQPGGHDGVEVGDLLDEGVGDLAGSGGAHRIRSSRADMVGRSCRSGPARSMAYASAPSTMPYSRTACTTSGASGVRARTSVASSQLVVVRAWPA